jgi:hypothetical protein
MPNSHVILDTLGKLYAHGHAISGYCLVCQRLFIVSTTDHRRHQNYGAVWRHETSLGVIS